jgi:glyoxylase-like metal-dependent hydrolase (beta-lactamase superfamily II)
MPGRPVAALALTHHHDDHAGGTRAFVAAGATVVTTAGNVDYLRAMAAAPRTLHPDSLARSPREPRIEVVRGRRVFAAGGRRLELIEVGPSPHVDEMLVAWLPEEGILFQGDLLNVPRGGPVPPAVDTTVHFAERLRELAIAPRVHVGVHGAVGGPEHLAEALERRRRLDAGEDPFEPS